MYMSVLSAPILPNAAKLTGCCFMMQMNNDLKHTANDQRQSNGLCGKLHCCSLKNTKCKCSNTSEPDCKASLSLF